MVFFNLYYSSPFPLQPQGQKSAVPIHFSAPALHNLLQRRETKIVSDLIQIQGGMKAQIPKPLVSVEYEKQSPRTGEESSAASWVLPRPPRPLKEND